VPRQNRVSPTGALITSPHRGTMLGNRGVLHDDTETVIRSSQHRRWLICTLSYRGRRRPIMAANRYTELFFLDETVALAAGHRPCAKCRHTSYLAYRDSWVKSRNLSAPPTAERIDGALHTERTAPLSARPHLPAAGLPDGTHILIDDQPWLVHGTALLRWTPAGYDQRRAFPPYPVPVLTPPSTIATLAAGYRPQTHPSVGNW